MEQKIKIAKKLLKISNELLSDTETSIKQNYISAKNIVAMPIVTTYKGVNIYLNGSDHSHLIL